MSQLTTFTRYTLILKTLRKKHADFEEIKAYMQREFENLGHDELQYSKRTFQRDVIDIRSLFKIEIQYNKKLKAYKIQDEEFQSEFDKRALETFDMFHALNVTENLSPYIHFEKRKPKGTEYFNEILQAIKNRKLIHFEYYKFEDDITTFRTVEPYALKEFKGRWYLLAQEIESGTNNQTNSNLIKTFGLDRINALETDAQKSFRPLPDFDAEAMFRNSFGIYSSAGRKPENITLLFSYKQGQYIKTYPLHNSQKVIAENDDYIQIQLQLAITHDLVMELLSYGTEVNVIAPERLKKEIKEIYAEAAKF
jgi:predicted DNA-binding transcriptional regulator YafY